MPFVVVTLHASYRNYAGVPLSGNVKVKGTAWRQDTSSHITYPPTEVVVEVDSDLGELNVALPAPTTDVTPPLTFTVTEKIDGGDPVTREFTLPACTGGETFELSNLQADGTFSASTPPVGPGPGGFGGF